MIWPSVPAAQIRPLAVPSGTPTRRMAGSEISPSMTMVAPMMPVEAAISVEISRTAATSARGEPPSRRPTCISMRSATRDFSSRIPISTKSGTASSSEFDITPKARCG